MAWWNNPLDENEKTWAIRLLAFCLVCSAVIVYTMVDTNKGLCEFHCKETHRDVLGWSPYSCYCGKIGHSLDNATPVNLSDLTGMPSTLPQLR
jgi:hypothetical protein